MVELSAASKKLNWTEPFHNTIGVVIHITELGEFKIRWLKIKKYTECSLPFQRKGNYRYKNIVLYSFRRKELKHAKRRIK